MVFKSAKPYPSVYKPKRTYESARFPCRAGAKRKAAGSEAAEAPGPSAPAAKKLRKPRPSAGGDAEAAKPRSRQAKGSGSQVAMAGGQENVPPPADADVPGPSGSQPAGALLRSHSRCCAMCAVTPQACAGPRMLLRPCTLPGGGRLQRPRLVSDASCTSTIQVSCADRHPLCSAYPAGGWAPSAMDSVSLRIASQAAANPLAAFKNAKVMEAAEQRRASVPAAAKAALGRLALPLPAAKKRAPSAEPAARPLQQVIPAHLLMGGFQAPKIRKM